jgi:hypothetical protein
MYANSGPLPEWEQATCVVCPAQLLGPGAFDVVDRPGQAYRYDPASGYRTNVDTGVPVCVHPFRVGLPPGGYASSAQPLPAPGRPAPAPAAEQLQLPEDVSDLEGWLVAVLRLADPGRMHSTLAAAERTASERFPARDVVAAMRRVLAYELARK